MTMSNDTNKAHPKAGLPSAAALCSASVEEIFRDVAMMSPAPPKDEDPYQSEEYQRFVESMVEYCHCAAPHPRPCDGVLAGGPCDGFENEPDYTLDDLEWEEAYG